MGDKAFLGELHNKISKRMSSAFSPEQVRNVSQIMHGVVNATPQTLNGVQKMIQANANNVLGPAQLSQMAGYFADNPNISRAQRMRQGVAMSHMAQPPHPNPLANAAINAMTSRRGGANWSTPTKPPTPREYPSARTGSNRRVPGHQKRGQVQTVKAYGAEYHVPRNKTGYLDFKATPTPPGAPRAVPVSKELPTKGNRRDDREAFIKHFDENHPGWRKRLERPLNEYRLHHHQAVKKQGNDRVVEMQLVLERLHTQLGHAGGISKLP